MYHHLRGPQFCVVLKMLAKGLVNEFLDVDHDALVIKYVFDSAFPKKCYVLLDFKLTDLFCCFISNNFFKIEIFSIMIHHFKAWACSI